MAGLKRNVSEQLPRAGGLPSVGPISAGTNRESRPGGSGAAPSFEVYDYEGHPVRIVIGADGSRGGSSPTSAACSAIEDRAMQPGSWMGTRRGTLVEPLAAPSRWPSSMSRASTP